MKKQSENQKPTEKETVKYGEQRSRQDRSKRTMLILAAIALVLILSVGGLIWMLVSLIGGGKTPAAKGEADVGNYLTENWPVFRLHSWDPETGDLELDYTLRFTFEQMEKYGASLEELRELPAGNLYTVSALKSSAYEDVGVSFRDVTVYGLTTDGAIAYTVFPDGSTETCWDSSEMQTDGGE